MSLALWLLLSKTEITTDLSFFLPSVKDPVGIALLSTAHEGPGSRMMLAEIRGGDPVSRQALSDQIKNRLKAQEIFAKVVNGPSIEQLKTIERKLFPYRMVLSDTPPLENAWSASSLKEALITRLAELNSAKGRLYERWLTLDPYAHWQRFLWGLSALDLPDTQNGHWVSRDGEAALILLETRAGGFDLASQSEAVQRVKAAFDEACRPCNLTLHLGGPGILAIEANKLVSSEAALISTANFLMVSVLLYFVYRSPRILALSLVPLFTGITAGALAVRLQYGSVHAITLGFGSTLLGVAADYPNHLFMHLKTNTSARKTLEKIWPTLRLGIATNIAGFGMMYFSNFKGLEELAVFAAVGLLFAGLSTKLILPELAPASLSAVLFDLSIRLARSKDHIPKTSGPLIPLVMTSLICVMFLGSNKPLFNDDITSMSPVQKERLEADLEIQRDFRIPDLRWIILIEGESLEAALEKAEALRPELDNLKTNSALTGYILISNVLPSQRLQTIRMNKIPDPSILAASLRLAIRNTAFNETAFDSYIEDVRATKQRLPLKPESLKGTPLELQWNTLVFESPEKTLILVPLLDLQDPLRIEQALDKNPETGTRLVDLGAYLSGKVKDNRIEAMKLLAAGLLVILCLLLLGLGNIKTASRVLSPMLLATTSTALLMAFLFKGLNIYHLASLLLVVGLSLDQALFFNMPFRSEEDYLKTRLSLWVCSASSILAFGGLALSSVQLLQAIGGTVASGAFFATVYAGTMAKDAGVPR